MELWSKTAEMIFQIEAVGHSAPLHVSDGHEWWRYFRSCMLSFDGNGIGGVARRGV